MPPSPVVVDVPIAVAPRPRASLAGPDSAPKLMPAIVIGISRWRGFLAWRGAPGGAGARGSRGAQRDVGVAAFAVALERIAGHGRAEKEQVVEVRNRALGAEATDVVDPLARGPLDLVDHVAVEDRALAQPRPPATTGGAPLDVVAGLA